VGTVVGITALVMAVMGGVGTIFTFSKTRQAEKTAKQEAADKATVGQMEQIRLANNDVIGGMLTELTRLRERAGAAETEAQRCEERCDKCVQDLAEATKRIAALEGTPA